MLTISGLKKVRFQNFAEKRWTMDVKKQLKGETDMIGYQGRNRQDSVLTVDLCQPYFA